jgi:hypothetical protein
MTDDNPGGKENSRSQGESIKWHPAFFDAIQLELLDYRDSLEFLYEYQLTSEPLRVDAVIIKKPPEVRIDKNFARLFREYNLVEYKSPEDYLSVNDFYKVYGYACLYAALNKAPVTALTLAFAVSRSPRELIKHLAAVRGYTVVETYPGIQEIRGDILPMQIIESKKLSSADNLWLKSLRGGLDLESTRVILKEGSRKGKEAPVGAYLDVILQANSAMIREVLDMSDGTLTLERVLEEAGLIAKYELRGEARGEAKGEARGEARGEEKARCEIAQDLLGMGWTVEQTARTSRLPIEKVQALYDARNFF